MDNNPKFKLSDDVLEQLCKIHNPPPILISTNPNIYITYDAYKKLENWNGPKWYNNG
jgi:hypothetical protein